MGFPTAMNPRNTFILVALAAGIFAFIFFFERHIQKAEPAVLKVLPGLKASQVTSIQIQAAGQLEATHIERTNGGWQLTKPTVYPAQTPTVESLLHALEGLSPQSRISAQELVGRHNVDEEFGFDTPQATLVIQQGEEKHTLYLGFLTPPGDHVYARVVGFEFIDIIGTDLFKLIRPRANDWRDTTFVNLKDLRFDRLSVANGTKAFDLQSDATNKLWRITLPGNMQARADNHKIEKLLFNLQNLRVSRFETDDPKADPEPFGFQSPALELRFDRGTNHLLVLQFGKSPTNDESQIYARHVGQPAIVSVSREAIGAWRDEPSEFRDPHLAGVASSADVIEVRGSGGENFTVRRKTNDDWYVTEPYNFPADKNLMRLFIQRLADLKVVRGNNGDFAVKDAVTPEEFPKYGLAPPSRKYILKQNAANATAASTNQVIAELDFGKTYEDKIEGDKVYARRGDLLDESSVYAVKAGEVQALPATGLQLRDRRIWSFSGDDVSRVTLRVNGKPEQLVRQGPSKWSIAAGSQAAIEEVAVEAGVEDLGDLEAETWVECGDQNRARYGFSDNSLQISFELVQKGKPRTLSIDFGGRSPRGLRYASVRMDDGQNWIFEFPADRLDRLNYCFNIHENTVP